MSALTDDNILHLAKLASLSITPEEIGTLKSQLSGVLDYFDELKKLRTDNVPPTSQTTGLEDVLRNDMSDSDKILSNEEALSGTDKTHNGAFVVPQVIDKES